MRYFSVENVGFHAVNNEFFFRWTLVNLLQILSLPLEGGE